MDTLTPSCFGSLDEDSDFQLPMPGLFGDVDSGTASVAMTDDFLELSPRTRIGMLNQWIRGFAAQRDASLVQMFRGLAVGWQERSIVQQVERFRQICASEGIACPSEFAVLLQRY